MSPEDFEFAAQFFKDRSGLILTRDKTYLLENRLMPLVRDMRLKSVTELIDGVRRGDSVLQALAVEAMMAKDTGFFRDWKPFTHLRTVVLPNLRVARGMKAGFRILSAGVSTGQEAYSVAMTIKDVSSSFPGWKVEVVGIDISAAAIAAATKGVYNQFEVQRGLPVHTLLQYFTKQDDNWALSDQIKSMVKFQAWNLLDDLYPLGRFDVVLCRNVLVYLDLKTKLDVLQKLARLLVDDGALYLGLNETVMGVSSSFRAINPDLGIYAAHRADRPASLSLAARVDL
ncbi:MAG: protein-glutamate O-methyltransferase CheR [Rhodospirillaceae bacterium]|nr:protein-glutamate O-methyltransferase CheR [Rhodospirillaceae bacterium]